MQHRRNGRVLAAIAGALLAFAFDPAGPHAQTSEATQGLVTDALTEAIRERVDHLRYGGHDARGARILADEGVARFYEARQFRPAWQAAGRLDVLVAALEALVEDGLDPADYHVDALRSYRLDVRMGTPLSPADRADLELVATDGYMLAAYHLYLGKVDPHALSPQWNFTQRPIEYERGIERLSESLSAGLVQETLDSARPQHPWYQRGRERLREYRAIRAAGGWPRVPEGPTLRPGADDPRVAVLRQRLRVTRDLAPDALAEAGESRFDDTLGAAVRFFQQRHGLDPDGNVGLATLRALNVPVEQRIDQMRVNLERARWTLHEIQGEFVLVDVAGFQVTYFRDDEPVWSSRVVVGRDQRETPVFRATITYVVFNPTWTIPPGILVKDKLPELRRDPGALKRLHVRVLDAHGREIDPHAVDWQRYGPGRLPPYQFRQDAGPDNALGLVKIMFPNPYLVYLHDSPAKALYERDQRTFSSGCIRVQEALELAELVLGDAAWTQESMRDVIASGATRTVNLKKPVPVLILYWTAQPRPDGQVNFRHDVYGRDTPTLAALDGPLRPPPRRTPGPINR